MWDQVSMLRMLTSYCCWKWRYWHS